MCNWCMYSFRPAASFFLVRFVPFHPCSSRLQPEGYKRLLSSASPTPPTVDTEPRDSVSGQQNGNETPEPSSAAPVQNVDHASKAY